MWAVIRTAVISTTWVEGICVTIEQCLCSSQHTGIQPVSRQTPQLVDATFKADRMVLTAAAPTLVHAVGGVLGFALVYGGASAVIWAGKTSTFPFYTGVVVIVVSWCAAWASDTTDDTQAANRLHIGEPHTPHDLQSHTCCC